MDEESGTQRDCHFSKIAQLGSGRTQAAGFLNLHSKHHIVTAALKKNTVLSGIILYVLCLMEKY